MTDQLNMSLPWQTLPSGHVGPEAPPLSEKQAPISKPNAGDELKNFRFTLDERAKVGEALREIATEHTPLSDIGVCINDIEAIINEGWQQCD